MHYCVYGGSFGFRFQVSALYCMAGDLDDWVLELGCEGWK